MMSASARDKPQMRRGSAKMMGDSGSKPLLMVIDDEPEFIEVLELLLADDFDLRVFSDPFAALDELEKSRFDLVLTDLNMPRMNGTELIQTARRRGYKVPIALLTGFSEGDSNVRQAVEAGANAVLTKPFRNPNDILEKLRKLSKP